MKTHPGTTVHTSTDEHGIIQVIDEDHTRALYFGTGFKQSAMDINKPDELLLEYTRALVTPAFLLDEPPKNILVCGLGGGSVVRFFQKTFPETNIDIIELRKNVTKIAQGYFHLEMDHHTSLYINSTVNTLPELIKQKRQYEFIVIDIFSGTDFSIDIVSSNFFKNCSELLSRNGILSINLWKGSPHYRKAIKALRNTFFRPALIIPVPGRKNVIHVASKRMLRKKNLQITGSRTQVPAWLNQYLVILQKHLSLLSRLLNKLKGYT
jgi:spermidine synthase